MKLKTFLIILSLMSAFIGLEVLWRYYPMQTTFGICWAAAIMFLCFGWIMYKAGKDEPGKGYWLCTIITLPCAYFFIWSPFDYYHINLHF